MSETVVGFRQSERKIMQDVSTFDYYQEIYTNIEGIDNGETIYTTGSSELWHDRKTSHAMFRISADQDIDVYLEQSIDGSSNDTTNLPPISYKTGSIQPPHIFVLAACSYWRLRIVNSSGSDTTSFRFGVYECSNVGQLNSPLNGTVAQNADSTVVRMIPPWLEYAESKFDGNYVANKMGRNPDIDSGTTPEDIITAGGTYAGFPSRGAAEFAVISTSGSDTGTLTFTYLASDTATTYSSATVTLNGTTEVETGISGDRAHTMRYDSGSATAFNVGTISLYHLATPANVFLTIPAGRSQSNDCVYTVPADTTGIIRRIHGGIRGSASASNNIALWVRGSSGTGPRYRRPNTVTTSARLNEQFDAGITVSAGTDIKLVATAASGTNQDVVAGFDIYLRRDQ